MGRNRPPLDLAATIPLAALVVAAALGPGEMAMTEQQARLELLGIILQHAFELAAGLRYAESLQTNLQEAYDDVDFVKALHKAEQPEMRTG